MLLCAVAGGKNPRSSLCSLVLGFVILYLSRLYGGFRILYSWLSGCDAIKCVAYLHRLARAFVSPSALSGRKMIPRIHLGVQLDELG